MLKLIVYLSLLVAFPWHREAPPPEPVEIMYYGGSQGDAPSAALPLEDGGMIVCGSARSTDGDFADAAGLNFNTYAFATRFDEEWNVVWQVIHGRHWMTNTFEGIALQADGSVVLPFVSFDRDAYTLSLVRIGPDGTLLSETDMEYHGYMSSAVDGENVIFVRFGDAVDLPYDPNLPWDRVAYVPELECVDADGMRLWRRAYPELLEMEGIRVVATPEGYVLAGQRYHAVEKQVMSPRGVLARLDDEGNLLWHLELDSGVMSEFTDAAQWYEGGIVAVGGIAVDDNMQAAAVWVDREGQVTRERLYPVDQYSPFMRILPNDEGYLLMGGSAVSPLVALVQIDPEGILVWSERLGTPDNEPFQAQQLYATEAGYCFVALAHVDEIEDFNNCDLVMMPVAPR